MRDKFMKTGQGFLLVFSLASRNSFDQIPDLRNRILRAKDRENVPIVLIGNKSDLVSQREVTLEQGQELAKTYRAPFFPTSAKNRTNVEEAFYELIREIRKDPTMLEQQTRKTRKRRMLPGMANCPLF